jgi:hypothetical protein
MADGEELVTLVFEWTDWDVRVLLNSREAGSY